MPTSATDWKYDPSLPAGSRPSASNWAAMYFAARRPPRVAGARPSSRSSARYFRWASMAVVLTETVEEPRVVGVTAGSGAALQANDIITTTVGHFRDTWLLLWRSVGASHAVDRPAASQAGFAGEHERGVVQEINRLSLQLEPGDVADRAPARLQTATRTRDERINLRVCADRHEPAVRPDRRTGNETTQRRERHDRQRLERRDGDRRVATPRRRRHPVQLHHAAASLAHEVERAIARGDVDRLHVVRSAGVSETQHRRRSGAHRPPPPSRWIGLGHGVDDYGFARPRVIARVRDVKARAAPRRAGAESDVLPVDGTGAADSDEAAVAAGQVRGVHIRIVPRVVVGPQHAGVRAAHRNAGALPHARTVKRARQGDAGDALQRE